MVADALDMDVEDVLAALDEEESSRIELQDGYTPVSSTHLQFPVYVKDNYGILETLAYFPEFLVPRVCIPVSYTHLINTLLL